MDSVFIPVLMAVTMRMLFIREMLQPFGTSEIAFSIRAYIKAYRLSYCLNRSFYDCNFSAIVNAYAAHCPPKLSFTRHQHSRANYQLLVDNLMVYPVCALILMLELVIYKHVSRNYVWSIIRLSFLTL
jgi:hypothetical protein